MSKNKAPTLIRQIDQSLHSRLAIGRSKRPDKADGSYRKYIYSWQTYKSYMKQLGLFARWCKLQHNANVTLYRLQKSRFCDKNLQKITNFCFW